MDEKQPPAGVILLTAADKSGAAFCAGALVALKEIGLLSNARHVVAAGYANLASFFLTRELALAVMSSGKQAAVTNDVVAAAWQQLCSLPLADFVERVVNPLRDACAVSQEDATFVQRLVRPCDWLSPWRTAFQRVVSRDYAMPGHTTASIEIDENAGCVKAPVFAFTGALERSSERVVFTTSKRAFPTLRIPCVPVLLPSSSGDRLSDICWGLGAPVPFSGVDGAFPRSVAAVVHNILPVDPLPVSVCDDLYLRSRMADTADKSRCLVLIDAYSHSPAFFDASLAVRSFVDRTRQLLCSAHDSQHETLRLYQRGLAQMYTGYPQQTARDALFASRSCRMASLAALEFEEAANWGYFQTAWQYAGDVGKQSASPPFESAAHTDTIKEFLQEHLSGQ